MARLEEDFIKFANKFVRLASIIKKDKAIWKEAFYLRLPIPLANQINRELLDDAVTFEYIVRII